MYTSFEKAQIDFYRRRRLFWARISLVAATLGGIGFLVLLGEPRPLPVAAGIMEIGMLLIGLCSCLISNSYRCANPAPWLITFITLCVFITASLALYSGALMRT